MGINNLKRSGEKIEQQLKEIRKKIGASLVKYSVDPLVIVLSGEELQELAEANPGKPIIINNKYCLAYIKDHAYHGLKFEHDLDVKTHPNDCFVRGNKVHFYYCKTIVYMSASNKRHRYHQTPRINNTRIIDLKNAENVETRLAWCKYCISILLQEGRVSTWSKFGYKSRIAEYSAARDLMDCVKSCSRGESNAVQKIRDFFAQTMMKK